jgi:hypothetical protein
MFPAQAAPVQPPRNPPWPRLLPALLLAALLLAPLALAPPARAADGFTEIGIDAPDPVPHAVRPSVLADDDPAPSAPFDDAEWAAWWREWRSWTPFAAQEPDNAPGRDRDADSSRLGGAAMPQPPGPAFTFANAMPLYVPGSPARSAAIASTPTITTTTTTTTTSSTPVDEEETVTLISDVPPWLLAEPPPVSAAASVIGEPASMALLGGAVVALGLLRRRRPAMAAG